MPLRDHFHSPVNDRHRWDAFHGQWPAMIVQQLFPVLPAGFRAEPKVHLGSPIEIDVATYQDDTPQPGGLSDSGGGGAATLTAAEPTLTVEADLSDQDQYEVLVYDTDRYRQLVAAIEIVSPSNKDRPDTREVFVGKVATLLQQGVCVVLVDLVSVRLSNLYADLLRLLGRTDPTLGATPPHLYAVSLRARKRPRRQLSLLDVWFYPMTVGQPLPSVPVWLSPSLSIDLPLEPSYEETCRLLHIA